MKQKIRFGIVFLIFLVSLLSVNSIIYVNETFEDGNMTDGSPATWNIDVGEWTVSSALAHTGTYSIKATAGGANDYIYCQDCWNGSANDLYISYWVYIPGLTGDFYTVVKDDQIDDGGYSNAGVVYGFPGGDDGIGYTQSSCSGFADSTINYAVGWSKMTLYYNSAHGDFEYFNYNGTQYNHSSTCVFNTFYGPYFIDVKSGTTYIDDVLICSDLECTTPPPPLGSQDSISFSNIQNSSTNSTNYFNWTTVGNYSWSSVYQGGVLLYNGTDKFYTQTGLTNSTSYGYNLSIYWNSSISNSTEFILTTNQTIQWRLNDLQTYLDLEQLKEESKMIWIVLLWGIATLGGIWLFHKRLLFAGLSLYMIGIITDLIISGEIYSNYIGSVSTSTVMGYSYAIAITLLALWIPFKLWLGYAVYNKI